MANSDSRRGTSHKNECVKGFGVNTELSVRYENQTTNQGKSLLKLHMPLEGKFEDSIKRQQIQENYGVGRVGSESSTKVLPQVELGHTEYLKKALNPSYDWGSSEYRKNAPRSLRDYLSPQQTQFRKSLETRLKAPAGGNMELFTQIKTSTLEQQNASPCDRVSQNGRNFTKSATFGRIVLKKQKSAKAIGLIPKQYRFYSV